MVLDREGGEIPTAETFERVVVEVHVGELHVLARQRVEVYTEAVVLAGDLDLAGAKVLDRMVGAAMAELELVRRAAQGQAQNLVA